MATKRIGIYGGTFDPVHAGHITFALQARQAAELDEIYFLPERRPRRKQGVSHFAHRVAMLKQAIQPYPEFGVLELPDLNLSVRRTLPRLTERFAGQRLVLLLGSDVTASLPNWPLAATLLPRVELAIGIRDGDSQAGLEAAIAAWPVQPLAVTSFNSHAPKVSSAKIREGLRQGRLAEGALTSVARYSDRHWLYINLPGH